MDLTQLRTFLAVAETGSFSAAGERLHSVQSNVTARIRKLEAELGGSVFERGRGGARLTPLGERLMRHASDILARVARAQADMRDAAGEAAPLRLGALEATAGSRLPPVLKALSLAAPHAEVTLATDSSGALTRRVWEQALDAAFVVGTVDADRFRCVPAFEETLVIVRAAGRPGREMLLAFADGCSYRAAALEWLRRTGRGDTPVRELGSLDAILGCVGAGMGFAVAPESAVKTYNALDTLSIAPLEPGFARSTTSLIWRADTRPNRTLEKLMTILRGEAGDAAKDRR